MSATTYVGNDRRIGWPESAFVRWKHEERGLCGAANQISWRRVESGSHPIDCAKAGTLNSAFQIANERTIQASLQVELHLRQPEFLSHRAHYFSKRSLHASTRLNLFSTFGHLKEHRALLSVVGQRVVTDNSEMDETGLGAA